MAEDKRSTREKKTSIKNSVGRLILIALVLLCQLLWVILSLIRLDAEYPIVLTIVNLLAIILALDVNEKQMNISLKAPILFVLLALPVLGVVFMLMTGIGSNLPKTRKRFKNIDDRLKPYLETDDKTVEKVREEDKSIASMFDYLRDFAGYPVHSDSDISFYPDATLCLQKMKEDLRKAEEFIFMEYHAIEDAQAFSGVFEILKEKAGSGVEVRILYDDIGSFVFISKAFIRKLNAAGIKCCAFNPMMPIYNLFINNRDHRKLMLIDGKVGFTGGFNLANEYFNITSPYGYWKDSGVRVEGRAVDNMTAMFLQMWNSIKKNSIDEDLSRFFNGAVADVDSHAFIAPYADSPIDGESVGENVYMNIINSATDYVWFMTPYLIITDDMKRMIVLAAKRGVDVRIIVPGIPDKKTTYQITKSYFQELAPYGVKIYTYTPGFCHAKECVSDDKIATCGTINLDYRSLYHNFEDGVLMYQTDSISDIKQDFIDTFPQCEDVTDNYKVRRRGYVRIFRSILRLLAPLF